MTILIFVHLTVLLALGFMLWRRSAPPLRMFLWPAYLLKLAAGTGIGLLYSVYYSTGDTMHYFHDGMLLADLARHDAGTYLRFLWRTDIEADVWHALTLQEPRALFLSKVVSVFALFTASNYWVISGYFSCLAFAGSWYLVNVICRYNARYTLAAVLAFLFFPSVVFWSSGIVKESLAMASLYFLSAVFLSRWERISIPWFMWIVVPAAAWFLWMLKYYYCAALFPVMLTAVTVRWLYGNVKLLPRVAMPVVWLAVFIVPLAVAATVHPNFYPGRFLEVIVSNYEFYALFPDQTDRIYYPGLEATAGSIAVHAPKALFSGLFRPLPWEAHSLFQLAMASENCFLLAMVAMCLWNWRRLWPGADGVLVFSIVIYIVVLAVFLALSTPNFGTLSRYRVGFVPFLVFLAACRNVFLERLQRRALLR